MIHLDGDNDVGGEGEPVTRENIKRFREHFGYKPGLNPVGRVDIVVLDVLTMNASEVLDLEPPKSERYRVGVSHVPVVPLAAGYSQFSKVWLPDGYSQIFYIICIWPFGLLDYGSATLRCKI